MEFIIIRKLNYENFKNISKEYYYLKNSYQADHIRILSLARKSFASFAEVKGKKLNDPVEEQNLMQDPAGRALIADVLEIFYLEAHITKKQQEELSPLLDTLPLKEQGRIIRTMLDFSPKQYHTKMIPWVVGCLHTPDQVTVLDALRLTLSIPQFTRLFVHLRQVLPETLCGMARMDIQSSKDK